MVVIAAGEQQDIDGTENELEYEKQVDGHFEIG